MFIAERPLSVYFQLIIPAIYAVVKIGIATEGKLDGSGMVGIFHNLALDW